jgi:hypothetical protein
VTADGDLRVAQYALRTFKVDYRLRQLRSVSINGAYWEDGKCVAKCMHYTSGRTYRSHKSPDERCNCGIYGTLDFASLAGQWGAYSSSLVTVIAAEGKTIIGDTGLKTEAARVVAYWSPYPGIRKICRNQCVDAVRYKKLSELLDAYNFPPGRVAFRWKLFSAFIYAQFFIIAALLTSNVFDAIRYISNHSWVSLLLIALANAAILMFAHMNYDNLRMRIG